MEREYSRLNVYETKLQLISVVQNVKHLFAIHFHLNLSSFYSWKKNKYLPSKSEKLTIILILSWCKRKIDKMVEGKIMQWTLNNKKNGLTFNTTLKIYEMTREIINYSLHWVTLDFSREMHDFHLLSFHLDKENIEAVGNALYDFIFELKIKWKLAVELNSSLFFVFSLKNRYYCSKSNHTISSSIPSDCNWRKYIFSIFLCSENSCRDLFVRLKMK